MGCYTTGKQAKMDEDIAEAVEHYNMRAEALAVLYNKRPAWMKMQLGLGAKKFAAKCSPSAWNGYVSTCVKTANEDLPAGEQHIHTSQYMDEHADELKENYYKLLKEEKDKYKDVAAKAQEDRTTRMRLTSKSISKDFDESFKGIVREASDTCSQTGGQAFVIATRGDAIHTQTPVAWATNGVDSWMDMTNRGTPVDMVLVLEGFTIGGCGKEARKPKASKAAITEDIALCRHVIQKGLDDILKLHKHRNGLPMNYRSYEKKIVQVYGITLEGWPLDESVKNPGDLGHKVCLELKDAFVKGTCKWVKLSAGALKARREGSGPASS